MFLDEIQQTRSASEQSRETTHCSAFVVRVRRDFPFLSNKSLIYLDSAATAQKPAAVLSAMDSWYRLSCANVHRGVYKLSERSTELYEASRDTLCAFLNARSRVEIVFTRGATEAINLVAYSWGRANVKRGDQIILSVAEHHSNIVPWQILAHAAGAQLSYVELTPSLEFSLDDFRQKLCSRTKLVAVSALPNGLGISFPIREIIDLAHQHGACVLVDAAQAAAHRSLDVQSLDADFLAFSGHKIYGPTGIGVLYAKEELLSGMEPFLAGGDMIRSVSLSGAAWNDLPYKFEAGTPNIAGAVGLGAAVCYLNELGFAEIAAHEQALLRRLEQALSSIPGVSLVGPEGCHSGLVPFVAEGVHPHDLAQYLDGFGVCVRAGHHCAQPLLDYLGLPATTRASLGIYNTESDIDRLREALLKALSFFRR